MPKLSRLVFCLLTCLTFWLLPALPAWTGEMPQDVLAGFKKAHPDLTPKTPPAIEQKRPQVLERFQDSASEVALTFDACSTWQKTGYDPEVIEILKKTETPATLFLGGLWMLRYSQETEALHDNDLFELGNHSYSHPDLTRHDPSVIRQELGYTQLIARKLTGEMPKLFRPPYVKKNSDVVDTAGELGMLTVQYDIASGDADVEASPEKIADYVLDSVRPGSIVILHMNNPELPTAEALPRIITGLELRGLKPVTVSQLKNTCRNCP
ncbi:polysaccharide deacetylase family protein [Desulfonatronospira sp.]|uniref:polysaccharide deacetylase family protein n=1 Tax=Desulfonatronospira sp. TaxID=1962951 RepID=UPI0025C16B73|nr:polysaccharide deacetylase family protein [Desulfonatronospira sp.]